MTARETFIFGRPKNAAAGFVDSVIGGLQHAAQSVRAIPAYDTAHGGAGALRDYWHEVIRDLEESTPCCFFLSLDSAAAWAVRRLSNRVLVVPLLVDDNQEQYEVLRRIAHHCNAVVALNDASRQRLFSDLPAIAPRIARFPAIDGAVELSGVARDCIELARTLRERVETGVFRRKPELMTLPSAFARELGGTAAVKSALHLVNRIVPWPDRALELPAKKPGLVARSAGSHRVVVTVPSGRISGVDIFSATLVQELSSRGMNAEILQTMADEKTPDALAITEGLPVRQLAVPEYPTWRQRWKALSSYLSSEPSVYIPNYDYRHSCVAPTLPHSVKVLGIAHSDDPSHYEHIARLAPYWDAVVAVSTVIHDHLLEIVPSLEGRIHTIPYGIHVPREAHTAPPLSSGPLRAVYAGRVVQYQKRAFDLIGVAREITSRGLPAEIAIVGTGEDVNAFHAGAASYFLSGSMRWIGSLSNDQVIEVFRQSHVVILPSRFEGLPLSLLEAMANGCVPIVASIRSGIPEIIRDGENGFVVPIGDTRAIADALSRIAHDEDRRVRMARAAYETVREFYSLELMTSRYVDVIQRMLTGTYTRPTGGILPPRSMRFFPKLIPAAPLPVRRAVFGLRDALK